MVAVLLILLLLLVVVMRVSTGTISGGSERPYKGRQKPSYYDQIRDVIPAKLTADRAIERVDEVPGRLKFKRLDQPTTTIHLGQLKLLLSEIQFMNNIYGRTGADAECLFVYAGSAPSNKGWVFAQMFPRAKMIFVDPAEHVIVDATQAGQSGARTNYTDPDMVRYLAAGGVNKYGHTDRKVRLWSGELLDKETDAKDLAGRNAAFAADPAAGVAAALRDPCRIFIAECYFTNILADTIRAEVDKLGRALPIYFVSDIRTSTDDAGIIWNNCMQYNWICRMQPDYSLLKFRAPFFDNLGDLADYMRPDIAEAAGRGLDALADYEQKKYRYFVGTDYLQAYSRLTSAETRLMVEKRPGTVPYPVELLDWVAREERMFYYNMVHRPYVYHDIPTDIPSGIDHCADCALAVKIMGEYLRRTRCEYVDQAIEGSAADSPDPVKYLHAIVKIIGRDLRHGPLEAPLTAETVAEYIRKHAGRTHARVITPASPRV
jgi:hypothetical protein